MNAVFKEWAETGIEVLGVRGGGQGTSECFVHEAALGFRPVIAFLFNRLQLFTLLLGVLINTFYKLSMIKPKSKND